MSPNQTSPQDKTNHLPVWSFHSPISIPFWKCTRQVNSCKQAVNAPPRNSSWCHGIMVKDDTWSRSALSRDPVAHKTQLFKQLYPSALVQRNSIHMKLLHILRTWRLVRILQKTWIQNEEEKFSIQDNCIFLIHSFWWQNRKRKEFPRWTGSIRCITD